MKILILFILIGGILADIIFLGSYFITIVWHLIHCLTFGKLVVNKEDKEMYRSLGVGAYILIGFIVLIVITFEIHSAKK